MAERTFSTVGELTEIVKGTRDYLIVSHCVDSDKNHYVSTGVQYLNQFSERCWTKKGFALKPQEAREYAAALLARADEVEDAILGQEDEGYEAREEFEFQLMAEALDPNA